MKKGRFLWSAHRITEKQKAGKARNIKGKQLKTRAIRPQSRSSRTAVQQALIISTTCELFRTLHDFFARLCAESQNRLKPWNAANCLGACWKSSIQ